jgi:hypothetical protein
MTVPVIRAKVVNIAATMFFFFPGVLKMIHEVYTSNHVTFEYDEAGHTLSISFHGKGPVTETTIAINYLEKKDFLELATLCRKAAMSVERGDGTCRVGIGGAFPAETPEEIK